MVSRSSSKRLVLSSSNVSKIREARGKGEKRGKRDVVRRARREDGEVRDEEGREVVMGIGEQKKKNGQDGWGYTRRVIRGSGRLNS